jgi:hypothetical protein
VLRLDDFYKSAGDPTLPLITEGANAGIVDWDVPASWLLEDAMAGAMTHLGGHMARSYPAPSADHDVCSPARAGIPQG